MARHDIIEKRKEWLENCNKEQQKEKMKQHELREREKKKQEEARLKEEWDKRERRRKEEEIRDIQAKHTQDKIAQLKNTEFGKKVKYFEASRLRLRSILFGSGSAINKIGSGSKS